MSDFFRFSGAIFVALSVSLSEICQNLQEHALVDSVCKFKVQECDEIKCIFRICICTCIICKSSEDVSS